MCDGGRQDDREGVEIEVLQNVVDRILLSTALADPVECVACSLHR